MRRVSTFAFVPKMHFSLISEYQNHGFPNEKIAADLMRGNKRPTRLNKLVFHCKIYCVAQSVSGTIMPIIRSSRFIQMVAAYGSWRFGLEVVGLVWSCGLCVRTRPTTSKPKRQVP